MSDRIRHHVSRPLQRAPAGRQFAFGASATSGPDAVFFRGSSPRHPPCGPDSMVLMPRGRRAWRHSDRLRVRRSGWLLFISLRPACAPRRPFADAAAAAAAGQPVPALWLASERSWLHHAIQHGARYGNGYRVHSHITNPFRPHTSIGYNHASATSSPRRPSPGVPDDLPRSAPLCLGLGCQNQPTGRDPIAVGWRDKQGIICSHDHRRIVRMGTTVITAYPDHFIPNRCRNREDSRHPTACRQAEHLGQRGNQSGLRPSGLDQRPVLVDQLRRIDTWTRAMVGTIPPAVWPKRTYRGRAVGS